MSRSGRDINGAARDYPSLRAGLANLRRDNQRRRRWDPRPSRWGLAAQNRDSTRHNNRSAPNVAEPIRRSIRAPDRTPDANPDRRAPDARPSHCRRAGRCPALHPPLWISISADQRASVSRRLARALRRGPIRECANFGFLRRGGLSCPVHNGSALPFVLPPRQFVCLLSPANSDRN